MASNRYRNKTCGYCGRTTGPNGEGEHVLPKCFYPELTDPKVQRLKIPACPGGNNSWAKDEGHFKTIITLCGTDETPARRQLWEKSGRSFEIPDYGERNVRSVAAQLIASPILNAQGAPYQRIFPHNDPRVVRILKKIVRGLTHFQTGDVIPEDRVGLIPPTYPPPLGLQDNLIPVYLVEHVFSAWALFFSGPDAFDMHSLWVLEFFDNVRFYAVIAAA